MNPVRWAHRLTQASLRRLYRSDAGGLLDEELLDEVGHTLYQRCRSILDVHSAKQGRVRCQDCAERAVDTWIERPHLRREDRELYEVVCPVCGWRVVWRDFERSFKRQQLNSGGALDEFQRFVDNYPGLREASQKMLAVDHLIHAFHYSVLERPDLPSRPVAPNLIQGKLEEVVVFLNELTFDAGRPGLEAERQAWKNEYQRYQDEYLGHIIGRQDEKEGQDG